MTSTLNSELTKRIAQLIFDNTALNWSRALDLSTAVLILADAERESAQSPAAPNEPVQALPKLTELKPTAWMVPVSGVYEYYATRHAAEQERSEHEASMGPDAHHEEPEPLYTAEQVRAAIASCRALELPPYTRSAIACAIEAEIDAQLNASGMCPADMQRQDGYAVLDIVLDAIESHRAALAASSKGEGNG